MLATVVGAKKAKPGQDFFPLTVDYIEKTYAAGRIPGGFFKREGKPSEKETLTSRLIDRPLRPLFPEGFYNEVQVVIHTLSVNPDDRSRHRRHDRRLGRAGHFGHPLQRPHRRRPRGLRRRPVRAQPHARRSSRHRSWTWWSPAPRRAVLMVESEAQQLSEEVMLGGVVYGHEQMQAAINAIHELVRDAGKPDWDWQARAQERGADRRRGRRGQGRACVAAYQIREKQARTAKLREVYAATQAGLAEQAAAAGEAAPDGVGRGQHPVRHGSPHRARPDPERRAPHRRPRHPHGAPDQHPPGRAAPRARQRPVHPRRDAGAGGRHAGHRSRTSRVIDALMGEYRERFMLHYNMPPFCDRRNRPHPTCPSAARSATAASPSARWRKLLPDAEDFHYTIRLVSEITESNGSSSMASVLRRLVGA